MQLLWLHIKTTKSRTNVRKWNSRLYHGVLLHNELYYS
jgi:hypothetical protein